MPNYTYQLTNTGYRVLKDGGLYLVQEGIYANIYPGETVEERAQNHINQIIADQAAADEAAQQPSEMDILGQTLADVQLQTMQLNSTVDTLGATVAQLQLENIAAKGGAS
ncbi:MAG: hypothetical protein E7519_12755 [Ruminococcaceae bacterium]|nr:hypothetical protein [Oscillospiraceae bacterium]